MSTLAPVSTSAPTRKKVTTLTFRQKKERGEPISMLTAYDYPTALAMDKAGIDAILVGDSLAMVVLGYENTLPVTMDEMLHHCRAVARGAKSTLLVGDMPFMSYQVSVEEATRNAGRFLQQGGMDAVKLEGGRERADAVRSITRCANSNIVTGWSLPILNTRPTASGVFISARTSRTTSLTCAKHRVCEPSPWTISGLPLSAASTNRGSTIP